VIKSGATEAEAVKQFQKDKVSLELSKGKDEAVKAALNAEGTKDVSVK